MSQKGFVTLAIVVIVVAALASAGVWYYEIHRNSYQAQSTQTPPSSTSSTPVGSSLPEIRDASFYVNVVKKIASIPAVLGLPPPDFVVNLDDWISHQARYTFPSLPANSQSVVDYFTNVIPSVQKNSVAVIYFRAIASTDSSASDGTDPSNQTDGAEVTAATTTISKLLVFDLKGNLLSATDLLGTPAGHPTRAPYGTYNIDADNGMSLLALGSSSVYIDESRGADDGYNVVRSANLNDGIVRDIIDNGIIVDGDPDRLGPSLPTFPLYGGITSPNGRYLAYNGIEGFGGSVASYSPDNGTKEGAGINENCFVNEVGANFSMSDLELLDFETGSTTLIKFDPTRGYAPVAWSKDGSTALVLIGTGNSNGCYAQTVNFMTYNVQTRQTTININLSNVQSALANICAEDGFDCSAESDWFNLSKWLQ